MDYIRSLEEDPPEGMSYRLIEGYESERSACLVYELSKGGLRLPMAQRFETDGDQIVVIQLIFDAGVFSGG